MKITSGANVLPDTPLKKDKDFDKRFYHNFRNRSLPELRIMIYVRLKLNIAIIHSAKKMIGPTKILFHPHPLLERAVSFFSFFLSLCFEFIIHFKCKQKKRT